MEKGTMELSSGLAIFWSDDPKSAEDATRMRKDRGVSTYRVQMIRDNDDDTATLRVYEVPGSSLHAFFHDPKGASGEPGEILTVAHADELPFGRTKTAHHEAGHAVACCEWGIGFSFVEVYKCPVDGKGGRIDIPDWQGGHGCGWDEFTERFFFQPPPDGEPEEGKVCEHIAARMAGAEAERRFLCLGGKWPDLSLERTLALSESDNGVCRLLQNLPFPDPRRPGDWYELWEEGRALALRLVSERWQEIEAVAKALVEHPCGRLTAEEVRDKIEEVSGHANQR